MAVAEAWCVTTDQAKLAIGVPVSLQKTGTLAFNAHRIYGTLNYPYLVQRLTRVMVNKSKHVQVTNWRYDWRPSNYNVTPDLAEHRGGLVRWYQPLYVSSKVQ